MYTNLAAYTGDYTAIKKPSQTQSLKSGGTKTQVTPCTVYFCKTELVTRSPQTDN